MNLDEAAGLTIFKSLFLYLRVLCVSRRDADPLLLEVSQTNVAISGME